MDIELSSPMHILDLPEEIYLRTFNFISTSHLYVSVANVCSHWRTLCSFSVSHRAESDDGCTDLSAVANASYLSLTNLLKCLGYTFKYSTRLKITATFEVDDKSLYKIAVNNPQLTHLYLYGCRHFTSAGVEAVCRLLPELEYIDIRECDQISQYTIEKLEKSVSDVVYDISIPEGEVVKILRPHPGEEQEFERHCRALKLPPNPTTIQMKKMYVRLSKEYHPDKQLIWNRRAAHEKFIAVDVAYKYLAALAT